MLFILPLEYVWIFCLHVSMCIIGLQDLEARRVYWNPEAGAPGGCGHLGMMRTEPGSFASNMDITRRNSAT